MTRAGYQLPNTNSGRKSRTANKDTAMVVALLPRSQASGSGATAWCAPAGVDERQSRASLLRLHVQYFGKDRKPVTSCSIKSSDPLGSAGQVPSQREGWGKADRADTGPPDATACSWPIAPPATASERRRTRTDAPATRTDGVAQHGGKNNNNQSRSGMNPSVASTDAG